MKYTKILWLYWAAMYVICTICGINPIFLDFLSGLFTLLGLAFFVPPAFLIYQAVRNKQPKILRIIRNLSLISLGLTLGLLLLNFATVTASKEWGLALYFLLNLVSAPMFCAQIWVIGLFGWAMLLMTCLHYLRKK